MRLVNQRIVFIFSNPIYLQTSQDLNSFINTNMQERSTMPVLNHVKWGIIGVGDVTEKKSGPAFSKVEHSEIVAVMRRNAEKSADYASRHGIPNWYSKADDLINDPEVNAIYIATPPDTHAYYTLRALEAGKPVYVEKPMARNYGECVQMLTAAENAGLPIWVAYYRRCLPNFLQVKSWLEEGKIGEVRGVQIQLFQYTPPLEELQKPSNWRVNPAVAGGGLFVDLAAHQLDILAYMLGPIVRVGGLASNQAGYYKAEDAVSANFEFATGAIGSGLWTFTVHKGQRRDTIELIGTQGRIEFPCFSQTEMVLETESGIEKHGVTYPEHVQQPLIQTIVDELRGKGHCPSPGIEAARTNWVMDQILSSYYKP